MKARIQKSTCPPIPTPADDMANEPSRKCGYFCLRAKACWLARWHTSGVTTVSSGGMHRTDYYVLLQGRMGELLGSISRCPPERLPGSRMQVHAAGEQLVVFETCVSHRAGVIGVKGNV